VQVVVFHMPRVLMTMLQLWPAGVVNWTVLTAPL